MKNKKIILLFLVSTLSQFPLSMIRFIVPIYAKDIGANTFILGLMGTAYGLAYIILATYFGKISEKIGQKKMIFMGLLIYATVILVYPAIHNPLLLILVRGGEAIGMAMVWPSVEAFSQMAKKERLEHSVLVYTLSWSIAASIAPYIGAIFMVNFNVAILVIFMITISSALISIFIPNPEKSIENPNEKRFNVIYDITLPIFAYGFNSAIIMSFYPAYGSSLDFGVMGTGIVLTVSGTILVFAFILSGTLLSSYGKRKITFAGLLLQLPFIFVSLSSNFSVQLISLSIIFFGQGLIYFNVLLNIISSFSKNVGSKTGIFESSIGAGFVLGPMLGGLPTFLNFEFPWIIAFAVSFVLLLAYFVFLLKNRYF